jgi:acetamidase/formamidase
MAVHHLDPTPETVTDVFSPDLPPVLTVDPGDTVIARTLDAVGYLERQRTPGEARPRMFAEPRGHCLAGPIAVRGAVPGSMLAVRLVDMRPDAWGWTEAGAQDNKLNRRLGVYDGTSAWLLWELDRDNSTGTDDRGRTVDLAPFLGVIGIPPRASAGGNIDCRDLVAGSTLYLPVNVDGGLLGIGDGHARQGDGEVCGTAIECGMTTEFTVDVVTRPVLTSVHAVTPTARITFGFDADLNEAMAAALDAMLDWMAALYAVDRKSALALASPTVDLRVTQVVNETWGVHAVLPHDAIR